MKWGLVVVAFDVGVVGMVVGLDNALVESRQNQTKHAHFLSVPQTAPFQGELKVYK